MRHLDRPQSGRRISASKIGAAIDELDAARRISVAGAGFEAAYGSSGRQLAVSQPQTIRLVEVTGEWQYNGTDTETKVKPGGWHYCTARLVPFFPIGGPLVTGGWSTERSADTDETMLLWSPSGYPGLNRDAMRSIGESPVRQSIPTRYTIGDWCWAMIEPQSGLWVLVDGYEEEMEVVLDEPLAACGLAHAYTTPGEAAGGVEIIVYDDFGRGPADDGASLLVRYMADRGHWVVILVAKCGGGSGSVSESSMSSGEPSESASESSGEPSGESGSDKSTAIVPASWLPSGYTAMFIAECPEVRFDDVMIVELKQRNTTVPIDPCFLEVCEAATIEVCGVSVDAPVAVGAVVHDDKIRVRFAQQRQRRTVRLVIRLTGIRRGFRDHRFPSRTRQQFEANERFIRSAYPGH